MGSKQEKIRELGGVRLSPQRTKYKRIPVADCPNCGLKDTPLSQTYHKLKHKDTGKELELFFIACPQCDALFNWDEETRSRIKGWLSVRDLKKMGYTTEPLVKEVKDGS